MKKKSFTIQISSYFWLDINFVSSFYYGFIPVYTQIDLKRMIVDV